MIGPEVGWPRCTPLYAEGGKTIGAGQDQPSRDELEAQRALLRAELRWGHAETVGPDPQPEPQPEAPPEQLAPTRDAFGRASRLIAAGILALIVLAGVFVFHTPPFELTSVQITGLHQLTAEEVWLDLGYGPGTYTWQVRPWVIARRLARNPLVAAVHTRFLWPGGIAIAVTERQPDALLVGAADDWEVSASGQLLRAVPPPTAGTPRAVDPAMVAAGATIGLPASAYPLTLPQRPTMAGVTADVPLVVGGNVGAAAAGSHLQGTPLLNALRIAGALGASGRAITGELLLGSGGVYLVTTGGIPVALGNTDSIQEKIGELLGILQDIQSQHLLVGAIDLSAPATPSLDLLPGSPPMNLENVTAGSPISG